MDAWNNDIHLIQRLKELIRNSFKQTEMLVFLKNEYPEYTWSLRTLQRRLQKLGLYRNDQSLSPSVLHKAVQEEVNGPGGLLGYRALHKKIRNDHNILAKRQDVYLAMNLICPEKLEERKLINKRNRFKKRQFKSKGSNWVWSMDGHDKLSGKNKAEFPFGIHAGIDTFSRKILWLKVWPSNCTPLLPGKLFYDAIMEHGYFPATTRSDKGSENVLVCAMQNFLSDAAPEKPAHIFGSSVSNQVIEQWWRGFRERHGEYFKSIFHELSMEGYYDETNSSCRVVLAYVFIPLIQNELDSFKKNWNTHRIRKQDIYRPCGIPNFLYEFPDQNGGEQCGITPDIDKMQQLSEEVKGLQNFLYITSELEAEFEAKLHIHQIESVNLSNAKYCYSVLIDGFLSKSIDFRYS